jgi:hypothetical protein
MSLNVYFFCYKSEFILFREIKSSKFKEFQFLKLLGLNYKTCPFSAMMKLDLK